MTSAQIRFRQHHSCLARMVSGEEKGRIPISIIFSIEGNKNIFSDTRHNTELLTPQPQAPEALLVPQLRSVTSHETRCHPPAGRVEQSEGRVTRSLVMNQLRVAALASLRPQAPQAQVVRVSICSGQFDFATFAICLVFLITFQRRA